ncbi:jerky-like protein [Lasius niger]|uniref:Jerky-like protein n=1 Tax=Lasius niger TaxID=67767 RepID=A0A0J7L9E9_LASNI|nr:jerky-like protein [Lasius niger]
MRSRRIPLTGSIIKAKAIELFNEMDLQENFTASNGWISRWKVRHGIRNLHITDKEMCVDADAAYKFKIELSQKIKNENITLAQIFNVGETGLYFRMLPVKTVMEKEERQASAFKQNEDYMTIMLCSNADGSLKLPLVVIGKHEKPRVMKNILHILPIYYVHESNEWMESNIFETWFKSEFVPRVTSFLQEKNLPIKAVLLFDDALWHPSVETLSLNNITAYDLPPNTTALIQPMDQGIIESLKRRYRAKLLSSFLNEQKGNIDAITHLKSLTIKDAVYWLIDAWNEVTTNTIFKSWRNILSVERFEHETEGLSLEPTDRDLLYFLHQIKNYENVTQDTVQKWILKADNIFPELPSNKEIIEIAIPRDKHENENETENIKEEKEEEEEEEKIDPACALSAAKILFSFVERNGLLEKEEELALLLKIKDRIITMNIAQ